MTEHEVGVGFAADVKAAGAGGGIQVARQRIQVGLSHAGKLVTIEMGDASLRIIDQYGELVTTVPRNGKGEISRFKAYGSTRAQGAQREAGPLPGRR